MSAPADFLRQMYAHRPDLKGNVDAVGFHPYARDPQGVYEKIAAFRHDLDAIAGAGVPIELTEIGWTTTDTSESNRAGYLREVASHARAHRLRRRARAGVRLARPRAGRRRSRAVVRHRQRDGQQAVGERLRRRGPSDARRAGAPTDTVRICTGSAAARDARPRSSLRKAQAGAPEAARQGPPPSEPRRAPDRQHALLHRLPRARRVGVPRGKRPRVGLAPHHVRGADDASCTPAAGPSASTSPSACGNSSRMRIKVTAFTGTGQKAIARHAPPAADRHVRGQAGAAPSSRLSCSS